MTQTFRPSVSVYLKSTGAVVAVGIPVVVALFLSNDNRLLFVAIVGAAALGSVGGVLLYIARARVYVTADSIGRRGFVGTKWIDRHAVSRGLLVLKLSSAAGAATHLFLFAPDRALAMRLYGALWGEKQLRSLVDALGVPLDVRAHILTTTQLTQLEPSAPNWAESNPGQLTAVVLGAFAVIAVVVAVVLYSGR